MVRVAVAVLAMAARVLALGPRVKTSWIAAMSNREVELAVTSTAKTRVRTRGAAGLGPESDVAAQVRAGDVVLELGGQLGETSSRIAAQCSRLVVADVARKAPATSTKRNRQWRRSNVTDVPNVDFVELARLKAWRGAISESERFDVVVVQDGLMGMDMVLETLSLAADVATRHAPRAIVLKSANVAKLAWRLHDAADFKAKHADGPAPARAEPAHEGLAPEAEPVIIAAEGVTEYRSLVPFVVRPGDAVLEIGCHCGTTVRLLHAAVGETGYAMGVDVGPSIIKQARSANPGLRFEVGDAWALHSLAQLRPRWDVVFLDVGGLSGEDGLLEALALARSLGATLRPGHIVIKSQCLKKLA